MCDCYQAALTVGRGAIQTQERHQGTRALIKHLTQQRPLTLNKGFGSMYCPSHFMGTIQSGIPGGNPEGERFHVQGEGEKGNRGRKRMKERGLILFKL